MAAWFKPKRYGYGATPTTWQGWLLTLGFVAVIVLAAFALLGASPSPRNVAAFLVIDTVLIAALWFVTRRMTAGQWRWRWGRD